MRGIYGCSFTMLTPFIMFTFLFCLHNTFLDCSGWHMINNCHIEQQLYLVYLPRWHPKIYNPAKMSQYLQTSWIPGLLAIPGLTDTVAPLFYNWHYSWFARMSTSPGVGLFETIHFWRSYDRLSHYLYTDDCCDARYSYCYHSQHPAIYIQYCEPGHVVIT